MKDKQEKYEVCLTKKDITDLMHLEDLGQFDYALPQPWVDEVFNHVERFGFTYDDIVTGIVWFYQDEGHYALCGHPFPITTKGSEVLKVYGFSVKHNI